MNYIDMLTQLNAGQKVRRPDWGAQDYLEVIGTGEKRIILYNSINDSNTQWGIWTPDQQGMFATDWEILPE